MHPGVLGTGGAAEDLVSRLDAVADHPAAAMPAFRGKCVNGALEAVEVMGISPLRDDLEGLVVVVTANFAFHTSGIAAAVGSGCADFDATPSDPRRLTKSALFADALSRG